MKSSSLETIYGRNPVYEVLRAQRRYVDRLEVAEGVSSRGKVDQIFELAKASGVKVLRKPKSNLDRVHENHQGVLVYVDRYPYASLQELFETMARSPELGFILILDMIQDPQNMGVLLRTAEAVRVQGVVIPHRGGVGITPAVVASSAGASEHLKIVRQNLAQSIESLKREGLWIVGMEKRPRSMALEEVDFRRAVGLVVGNEGRGLRRLVRDSCDYLAKIPMGGEVESLNAAVAGSIALYEARKARG